MGVFTKRVETYKFGEFMKKEGKCAPKEKTMDKEQVLGVLKGIATTSIIITASKVMIPALAVSIPIALVTSKIAVAATTTNVAPYDQAAVMVGAIPEAIKGKIIHAFDPLIDLMVGLSVPIAGVMLTGGALMTMIGQKEAGMKLIMNCALGYILVNLSPMLLNLLVGISSAM